MTKYSNKEIIHYGPNPCHSTITWVDGAEQWNESETGVLRRVTCSDCKTKNERQT